MDYLLAAGYLPAIGGILWLVYVALSAKDERSEAVIAREAAVTERNAAVVEAARLTAELATATARLVIVEANLATERKKVISARIDAVTRAAPDDVVDVSDRMLAERLLEQAAHDAAIAALGRGAAADSVSRSGTEAKEPTPVWADEH